MLSNKAGKGCVIKMLTYFWIDLIFTVLLCFIARIGVRDSFEYKKSKSQIRTECKIYPMWRHFLRVYPCQNSNAPRHMKLFLIFRGANWTISSFFTALLLIARIRPFAASLLNVLIALRAILVYLPFFLYTMCIPTYPAPGKRGKQYNFDSFRNP